MEQWKLVLAGGALTLVGVVMGAVLFGSQPVVAQEAGFRECFFAFQEYVDVNTEGIVALPDRAHTIVVPRGYVPVSGGGATVLFCRR